MNELLKDKFFNPTIYNLIVDAFSKEFPTINKANFLGELEKGMDSFELNERILHAVKVIHKFTRKNLTEKLTEFKRISFKLRAHYCGIIFPKYVEIYHDKNDLNTVFIALEAFTMDSSAEFAIRFFLRNHPKKTLPQMFLWSKHRSEHVRRLASEGLRPLLPWSFQLTPFLNYPKVSFNVLKNLNNDSSLYVRKSVANHLNDLSKICPEKLMKEISTWDTKRTYTAWIIKKGLRTLIKNGNQEALSFYNFQNPSNIALTKIEMLPSTIKINQYSTIKITLNNTALPLPVILDFQIEYLKKNKSYRKKIFKWKEFVLPKGIIFLEKKIFFKQMSTRTHYQGTHYLAILINGIKYKTYKFTLI